MNKTIIINISGIIFHIEEDAYDKLKIYMSEVKAYFNKTDDSFEIISDIENRVAELFTEIIKAEQKEVIVSLDVEKVIRTMGKPADFEKEFQEEEESSTIPGVQIKKRLYRNPDDKLVGGVCSGIAAYFNIDPIWIRLLLIVSVFFFGTGVFLYIVLWFIMPEAITRTEKLAMRGESPTLESIRRSVEEEINGMRRTLGNKSNGSSALRVLINNIADAIQQIVRFGIKIIYKAIGALLVGMSIALTIALTIGLLTVLGIVNTNMDTELPLFMIREDNQELLLITAFLVIIVPALAIMLLGIRILININPFNKISGLTLIGVWLLSLMISVYYSVDTIGNFKEEGNLQSAKILNESSIGKFYLITEFDESVKYDTLKTREYNLRDKVVVKTKGLESIYNNINLRIEKSESNEIKLVTNYISRGPTEKQAIEYAENIVYEVKQNDSVLIFPEYFTLKKKSLWRTQEIQMTLYLPLDKEVILHEDVDRFTRNIYSYGCKKDQQNRTYWKMTFDGLVCEKDTTMVQ